MKKLTNGQVLIVSHPATKISLRHDPWHIHSADSLCGFDYVEGDSGAWYGFLHCNLIDLKSYYYLCFSGVTFDEVQAFFASYAGFTAPDGVTGFVGEWFNFRVRPTIFEKIAATDFAAWVHAH